jgi:rhomboid family GlyGly-CTERM serine protease
MASIAWRTWWLPVFIVTVSALLQFGTPFTSEWLRFQPDRIWDGEIWRLASAHFVHLSWGHYLINEITFLAICGLFTSWLTPGVLVWWILISACSVGLGLLGFDPQLGWYVGLSGVLHGLLVAGSLRTVLAHRFMGTLVLIAVILKLIWEQIYGPIPGSEATTGGRVIVNAHLYGAFGGLAAVTSQRLVSYWPGRWCWLRHLTRRSHANKALPRSPNAAPPPPSPFPLSLPPLNCAEFTFSV